MADNTELFMTARRLLPGFLDSLRLNVKGGTGGMGLPRYGGVGGKGGDIIFVAKDGTTLKEVTRKYPGRLIKAENGEGSSRRKIYGEAGADKVVNVPLGITVLDEYRRSLGELNQEGQQVVVAHGGPGGTPSSLPAFNGNKGIQQVVTLDLKLIADVGLVGFPNAGKSTLLKAVSKAKPKIAAYPFTTIKPNVATMEYSDLGQVTMADLPGLIEGASYNIGMGHRFLKHVERTRLLLLVADVTGFRLSPKHDPRTCIETVVLLNKELELYKAELLEKPAMLLVNKMDLPGAQDTWKEIKPILEDLSVVMPMLHEKIRPSKLLKFERILPISAAHDPDSTDNVKVAVREVLEMVHEMSIIEEVAWRERELIEKSKRQSMEVGPGLI